MPYKTLKKSTLKVLREFLQYLSEHPDAKDTLEGITQWWLHEEPSQEEIEESIEQLLRQGWILKTSTPPYLISLNKDHLDEIKTFLEE